MPEFESHILPSGAELKIEKHMSPEGLPGTVGHWGEEKRIEDIEHMLSVKGVRAAELDVKPGFTTIFHNKPDITRKEAIADDIAVLKKIATTTLEMRGIEPSHVDVVGVGAGIPTVDDNGGVVNEAELLGMELGMRGDVEYLSTYAACASQTEVTLKILGEEKFKGKTVLSIGRDGVPWFTHNYDLAYADDFSIRAFSNGAAGNCFVVGEDMKLLKAKHDTVEDTVNALAAQMTYEELIDPENPSIWQEDNKRGISMIRYPKPRGIRRLEINNREAALLFALNGVPFIGEISKQYVADNPGIPISYASIHPASKGMYEGIVKRLGKLGVQIPASWGKVTDGNCSSPTTWIDHNRSLEEAKAGKRVLIAAFGAGARFAGGVIEYGVRK